MLRTSLALAYGPVRLQRSFKHSFSAVSVVSPRVHCVHLETTDSMHYNAFRLHVILVF